MGSNGQREKEEGMGRVMMRDDYPEFSNNVLRVVAEIAASVEEFTVARVRYVFNRKEFPGPTHANMWGPAMKRAVRAKLIVRTDRVVASSYPKTAHARMIPVYRSVR